MVGAVAWHLRVGGPWRALPAGWPWRTVYGWFRRWLVERSFGWLSHWGGRARDRAGRLDVSAARIAFVGALSGFEALLNPMSIRAPAQ